MSAIKRTPEQAYLPTSQYTCAPVIRHSTSAPAMYAAAIATRVMLRLNTATQKLAASTARA